MELYDGQLKNHVFNIERHRNHHKRENKDNLTIYNNSILTFDIEVTSAWLENGEVIGYRKYEDADYWNELEPLSLCYIWQFSCDGKVYYGRELTDFIAVLKDIPNKYQTVIWVHNLSYEFMFLSNFLTWKSIFARSPHKPIKCVSNEFPNIEFRCSYILTRLSLEAWGKELKVEKAVGELDYEKVRTPLTTLTKEELHYCEQDCLVVEAGIKSYLKRYKRIRDIPLTQTGTVRKEVKNRLTCNKSYVKKVKKLVPKDARQYRLLQSIFAGGYTHANRLYSGTVIEGIIEHYDFSSSYPYVMISEKYPMSQWTYIAGHTMPNEESFDEYAYILRLSFKNIQSISYNTYIQGSKVYNANGLVMDNGRVIKADELSIDITELDYMTIKENYEWESVYVIGLYRSKKEYLPLTFTEYILQLYKNKTELKDIPEFEDIYMQSKQYINSMFGMCVTAIIQADVELENDEWHIKKLTEEEVNNRLNKLRDFNPREKRYFLSYSWGCYVTAYARRNLWKCIKSIDSDVIYADTDSIFCVGRHDFTWYNNEVNEKLRKVCEETGLKFELTRPKNYKNEEVPLGIFTPEPECIEFITLGAKRYVERRIYKKGDKKCDGKLHLTVSGINKEAVELLNDDIENFVDEFDFDKDAECVKKRLLTYITNQPPCVFPDGYVCKYTHGINLRRTGYKLTMTDEYKKLINYMEYSLDDIPEETQVSMRGRFVFS